MRSTMSQPPDCALCTYGRFYGTAGLRDALYGARRLRFRLCCARIRALFWHGRAMMHLMWSTVYGPPGCAVRTPGRPSAQLGGGVLCGAQRPRSAVLYARLDSPVLRPASGVPCAERGTPAFRLRSLHVWTQLWCGRTVARLLRRTALQPSGCTLGPRWAGHWTGGQTLALSGGGVPCAERDTPAFRLRSVHTWEFSRHGRAVTHLVRSTVCQPPGCAYRTFGHTRVAMRVCATGRRYALPGSGCTALRLYISIVQWHYVMMRMHVMLCTAV